MGNAHILRPPHERPHGGCLSCRRVVPGSIQRDRAYTWLMCEFKGYRDNGHSDQIGRGCWLWEREPGTDDEELAFPYR